MKLLSCRRLLAGRSVEVRIQQDDFSIDKEWQACRQRVRGQGGAIVAFAGLVRDSSSDDSVTGLYLEHYPGMTEKSIKGIVRQSEQRWNLLDVVVIHRIGELKSNDQIVLVLVASSHRPDAFAACEFIMDFLKTEAVFWKKELRDSSSEWVRSTESDYKRRDEWAAD